MPGPLLVGVYGGKVANQSRHYHLDEDDRVSPRPDILWRLDGQDAAVADAKYKDAGKTHSRQEPTAIADAPPSLRLR